MSKFLPYLLIWKAAKAANSLSLGSLPRNLAAFLLHAPLHAHEIFRPTATPWPLSLPREIVRRAVVEPTIEIRGPRARAGGVRTSTPMMRPHEPMGMKPLRGRSFCG
jgi:hypothetical protein